MNNAEIEKRLFTESDFKFNDLALEIFRFQISHCHDFRRWCELNGAMQPATVQDICFMPVSFFKKFDIYSSKEEPSAIFRSSSTTGQIPSQHKIKSLSLYETSFTSCFQHFYGNVEDYCWLCLLPGYIERGDSSLVYMAQHFIQRGLPGSGFYLNNMDELLAVLQKNETEKRKTMLLGVTFALLDFAGRYNLEPLKNTTVMETGGMKGRGPELTRKEVHKILNQAFGTKEIHSEYGMTELLSQAYSKGNGRYYCPPHMRILIQDAGDPGTFLPVGHTGKICVIDQANIYSCSFLATDDLGKLHNDGSFEVLGRHDQSETRGCNLMVS